MLQYKDLVKMFLMKLVGYNCLFTTQNEIRNWRDTFGVVFQKNTTNDSNSF